MDDDLFKNALKDAVDDGNVDELDFLLASYRWGNNFLFWKFCNLRTCPINRRTADAKSRR